MTKIAAKIKTEMSTIGSDSQSNIQIPISVLADRRLSVLEVMVEYLKENKSLSFHQIAALTNRDDRTIWTVYSRARKKRALFKDFTKTGGGRK